MLLRMSVQTTSEFYGGGHQNHAAMFGTLTRPTLALLPAPLCKEMSCLHVVSCTTCTLNQTTEIFDLSPEFKLDRAK